MASRTPGNWRTLTASKAKRSISRRQLAPALARAVAEPGPYLLNVKVSPMECVYPMVPAGSALSEMVLGLPQREAAMAK